MFIYFKTRGEGTSSFLFERPAPRARLQHPVLGRTAHYWCGDLDLTFLLREDIAIDAAIG